MTWKQLVREPNFWIGIALACIVIPILIYAIIKHETDPIVETDWQMVSLVPTTRGRKALRPMFVHDRCQWTAIGDKTVDQELLRVAAKRWNDRVCEGLEEDCQYLCTRVDPDLFFQTKEKSLERYGNLFVSVETLSDDTHGGITNNVFDQATAETYYAVIKINHAHTTDRDSYLAALMHELGHGLLLGHPDDRHKTSIMRKRLNVRGTITDHEAELLRDAWITAKRSR